MSDNRQPTIPRSLSQDVLSGVMLWKQAVTDVAASAIPRSFVSLSRHQRTYSTDSTSSSVLSVSTNKSDSPSN